MLADFDASYRQSNWMHVLAESRDLSRALRDEDPARVRDGVVHLVSWLFALALYFQLDLDSGWRNWTNKVRRKTYLPKVTAAIPGPDEARPPAGPSWRA